MVYKVDGNPQLDSCDWSMYSNILKDYLFSRSIATSRTSRYNPKGNGQVERYNGIIWNAIHLALKTQGLDISQWEAVLPDASDPFCVQLQTALLMSDLFISKTFC